MKSRFKPQRELNGVREVALALPGVSERIDPGGALCFVVQKKTLC